MNLRGSIFGNASNNDVMERCSNHMPGLLGEVGRDRQVHDVALEYLERTKSLALPTFKLLVWLHSWALRKNSLASHPDQEFLVSSAKDAGIFAALTTVQCHASRGASILMNLAQSRFLQEQGRPGVDTNFRSF